MGFFVLSSYSKLGFLFIFEICPKHKFLSYAITLDGQLNKPKCRCARGGFFITNQPQKFTQVQKIITFVSKLQLKQLVVGGIK